MSSIALWYDPKSLAKALDSALTGPLSEPTSSIDSDTDNFFSSPILTTTTASESVTKSPILFCLLSTVTRYRTTLKNIGNLSSSFKAKSSKDA